VAKVKLTKGELKRQRDALEQFQHYLPTLQLKKQQLQIKILDAKKRLAEKEKALKAHQENIDQWVGLLAEAPEDFAAWVIPERIITEPVNVAGATMGFFKNVEFPEAEFDLYTTPFWVDTALEVLRDFARILVSIEIIKQQIAILSRELRTTTQRVNLFEKVKIPECEENIRRIRIYLGDQQANAVGIGKVAKKKIEMKEAMAT
jgi:V/A-type H+-transporting ATPase subunit D